ATRDQDGKVWVSLRRCCESLGLSIEGQLKKLKGKAWATMNEKFTVAEDGKQRSVACIDLGTLPGWLFSIDPRKVKEDVREKLALYQKEAALVLAEHFFGQKPGTLAVTNQIEDIVEDYVSRATEEIVTRVNA